MVVSSYTSNTSPYLSLSAHGFAFHVSQLLGFSGGSECKKNLPAMQETSVQSLGQEDQPMDLLSILTRETC